MLPNLYHFIDEVSLRYIEQKITLHQGDQRNMQGQRQQQVYQDYNTIDQHSLYCKRYTTHVILSREDLHRLIWLFQQ